jgi:hypothetical protein
VDDPVGQRPEAEKTERERKLATATEAAHQFLVVLDTKKSGKISKREWMTFMDEGPAASCDAIFG